MVETALAIGLGQLLAIGVHALTWWVRKRALWLIAILGLIPYVLGTLFFYALTGLDTIQGDVKVTLQAAGIALLIAAILGLYHSFLLGRRWKWFFWIETTFALFAEMGIAGLIVWGIYSILPLPYDASAPAFFYTLISLALFRPLILKFLWPVVPVLRGVVESSHNSV